jgi:hypothetical protein
MHKKLLLAAVLMAALSGCGDDEESKSAQSPAPGGNSPPPPTVPVPVPAPPSQPGAATLEWTAPTTQTNGATLGDLAGFRIHYGKSAGSLDKTIVVRNPSISSYVVEGLPAGTYYFAVSAFNSRNHESERSNAGRKEIS